MPNPKPTPHPKPLTNPERGGARPEGKRFPRRPIPSFYM